MNSSPTQRHLADLVRRTLDAIRDAKLPLDMPGSHELSEARQQLITQLEARILPHLEADNIPAVIVFGGSSGAGKSTLVNSLVGKVVTDASVLRPTTRTPVMVIHPDDEAVMRGHVLERSGTYQVIPEAIPGIVLVDAPDLDSVDASNREISARLLDSADLWVFVTTAARYGDAVAWSSLEMAYARGITCAVVLDRVPDRAREKVRQDLLRRMTQVGLAESPLFIVKDFGAHSGPLPAEAVAPMRTWLETIAGTRAGEALVERTTKATLPRLRQDLLLLADAVEAQDHALIDLKDKANEGAQAPLDKLETNIFHGRFGQGAPTTSWLALASTGGPLAGLVAGRKPPIFTRNPVARDNAMTSIFDAVLTSARVALTQGLTTARENIEQAWVDDVVDTSHLRAQALEKLDLDVLVDHASNGWKADLMALGKQAGANVWLSSRGMAALLGVAAGGITGAGTVAERLAGRDRVDMARTALVTQVRTVLEQLVGTFTDTVDNVHAGDSAALRLRASELLDRA